MAGIGWEGGREEEKADEGRGTTGEAELPQLSPGLIAVLD
jgi:hypothetical protein